MGSASIIMAGSMTLQDEYTPNTSLLIYQQRLVRKYNSSGGRGRLTYSSNSKYFLEISRYKVKKNVYCQNENDTTFPEGFFFLSENNK